MSDDYLHLPSTHDHSHELDPRDALARGALMLGVGLMLLTKVWEGSVPFYIHPRYTWLVAVAAVFLVALAAGHLVLAYRALGPHEQRIIRSLGLGLAPLVLAALVLHSTLVWAVILPLLGFSILWLARARGLAPNFGWSSVWLALPIIFGLLVASKPLGAAGLESKNVLNQNSSLTAGRWKVMDPNDTTKWTLVNWASALWQADSAQLAGKPVDVVGFVYHPKDSQAGQFSVARFVVACCTADSSGVSLAVRWPGGETLATDSWVRVVGALKFADTPEGREPYIEASEVAAVPRPATPYLYP